MTTPVRTMCACHLRAVWLFCLGACAAVAGAAAEPAKRPFDLPADSAEKSLKRFSVQSGIEVVFATHVTEGVRTVALKGEFPPLEALTRLLAGTTLVSRHDERSGTIFVSKGT